MLYDAQGDILTIPKVAFFGFTSGSQDKGRAQRDCGRSRQAAGTAESEGGAERLVEVEVDGIEKADREDAEASCHLRWLGRSADVHHMYSENA